MPLIYTRRRQGFQSKVSRRGAETQREAEEGKGREGRLDRINRMNGIHGMGSGKSC